MRPLVLTLCLFVAPALARADGGRCVSDRALRRAAHQEVILLLNPMGAQHTIRVGACAPLYGSSHDFLDDNHVELGVTLTLSPIFTFTGGYVEIAPATFVFFRVELAHAAVWPLPLDGAGYFAREGYEQRWSAADLPASSAESAVGWSLRLLSVWRGRLSEGSFEALILDAFFVDRDVLGAAPYYASLRHDLITRREDWVIGNEAYALAGHRFDGGPSLRVGVFDALRHVPASGYVGHQVGPLVMLAWEHASPELDTVELWIRLGYYTHHGVRQGEVSALAGLAIDWDLGPI
jgi:hypothetical protein